MEDSDILERINRRTRRIVAGVLRMVIPTRPDHLFRYFDPHCVAFFEGGSKEEILQKLVELSGEYHHVEIPSDFLNAVLQREQIVSTGIGMGIAIPHAKLQNQKDFFICVGIIPSGVEWKAFDGEPCQLVFLIGGPDNRPNDYLHLLSRLTSALRDEERRKKMLKSTDPVDILSTFKGF